MPILVQVLVRDIAGVLLADLGQPVLERRVGSEEQRAGLLQAIDEIQHAGHRDVGPLRARHSQHPHQRLHRHHRGPTGRDIITEVDQSARLQSFRHSSDQMFAVARRDPAQHAVRYHDVEVGQVLVRLKVGERTLHEPHVGKTGACGESVGEFDMRRIEVESPDIRMRACCCDDECGEAVATAQIGVAERRREVRRSLPEQQARRRDPVGRDLAIEVAGVGHVGDVAVVPLGHARRSPLEGARVIRQVTGGRFICQSRNPLPVRPSVPTAHSARRRAAQRRRSDRTTA